MYNLFLDDVRDPQWVTTYKTDTRYNKLQWVVVRSHNDFVDYIKENGIPNVVSIDHDLGDQHYETGFRKYDFDVYDTFDEKTGYDSLKWLCEYVLDNGLKLPEIKFHTANYVGLQNMQHYLINFIKHNPQVANK